jgi:DNA helicase INO80
MSPAEAHHLHLAPLIRRRLLAAAAEAKDIENAGYWYVHCPHLSLHSVLKVMVRDTFSRAPAAGTFRLSDAFRIRSLHAGEDGHEVCSIATTAWSQSCLSRPFMKWFVPSALAPPIAMYCSDRTFLERQAQVLDGPSESLALYGLPPYSLQLEECCKAYQTLFCGLPPIGLIGNSRLDQLPTSAMQVPDAKRLIYDSAKLARLDLLLQELKAGDHRILIYFQMTRMMDLMEEYLIHRQYKYLRLDGSSKLEDRRDMVIDWQTR